MRPKGISHTSLVKNTRILFVLNWKATDLKQYFLSLNTIYILETDSKLRDKENAAVTENSRSLLERETWSLLYHFPSGLFHTFHLQLNKFDFNERLDREHLSVLLQCPPSISLCLSFHFFPQYIFIFQFLYFLSPEFSVIILSNSYCNIFYFFLCMFLFCLFYFWLFLPISLFLLAPVSFCLFLPFSWCIFSTEINFPLSFNRNID